MADIISIATAVPEYCHRQDDIIELMAKIYKLDQTEKRKLAFLYKHSGIDTRYSVIDDYSLPEHQWDFLTLNGHSFPSLEERMKIFDVEALKLSLNAVKKCIDSFITPKAITHLITVSCTGMSAPGLDLQLAEALDLSPNVFRTSINFMGCYAAIHALKLAKLICDTEPDANVVIADTELCTLHFQQEYTADNAASSLLFADGSAAVLVSNKLQSSNAISLTGFFSHVAYKGKKDMAWELSSKGFLMTLSGYIPQLIKEDIDALVAASLNHHNINKADITHWCIHPGGKKIVEAIEKKLDLTENDLHYSSKVLAKYGNMSSPTVLFVLEEMMHNMQQNEKIFGVAFGPGLTMETFLASKK
ncbi:type III polyketide synthase [Panacibacter ginsenosidivorans]|uniref:Type III polyketide synthase n=1 Tax=Panacibacter ginsenosidivorans TaxID=1813871 RepID=A0A5B8V3I9_9BACT|nr:type III polyketide synthase [Panacibacter ginsenosidivorans]QEC66087.1 type III polyketide synthase [Panacibacter ginsenosidivorans]